MLGEDGCALSPISLGEIKLGTKDVAEGFKLDLGGGRDQPSLSSVRIRCGTNQNHIGCCRNII